MNIQHNTVSWEQVTLTLKDKVHYLAEIYTVSQKK